MKFNDYLVEVVGIERSDFEYLSERIQNLIRREHELANSWLQMRRRSHELMVDDLTRQGWVEDDNGHWYNVREEGRQNAYAILADCGVPFIDGEPVGIWSD